MLELPEIRLLRADGQVTSGETKFGGEPTWMCGEFHEERCGQPMALLGQFDALDYPELDWPGRAVAYVFVYTKCFCFWMAASAPDHPYSEGAR